jgi:hypothetical protein
MTGAPSKCILIVAALLALGLCGCAGVALEEIGAGAAEAGATGEAMMAPAIEGAGTAGAVEGVGAVEETSLLDELTRAGAPREVQIAEDGGAVVKYVNGNMRFSVDWSKMLVSDDRGNAVASIEGNLIYRTFPPGSRELFAQIVDTKLLQPARFYSAATVKSNLIRILETGEYVQVLEVSDGWYQLKSVDGTTGWIFAPLLLSHVDRDDGSQKQRIVYATHPSERDAITSTLETAADLRNDIRRIVSAR